MRLLSLIAVFWMALAAWSPAEAERRVALVIGNRAYPKLATRADPQQGQLSTPIDDARTMEQTLGQLGFDVTVATDVDRTGFYVALEAFRNRIEPGDTALFFYAGHGVGLKGANFLLPSDIPPVDPNSEQLLRSLAVSEIDVIAGIQDKGARLIIMVLDACRDNPIEEFARRQAQAAGRAVTRNLGLLSRGLAPAERISGVLSIYSAGIGQRALDRLSVNDPVRNSVFTRVFAQKLKEPGLSLNDLISDVQEEVFQLAMGVTDETGQPYRQTPSSYNETRGGRIYLAGRPVARQSEEREAAARAPPLSPEGKAADPAPSSPPLAPPPEQRLTSIDATISIPDPPHPPPAAPAVGSPAAPSSSARDDIDQCDRLAADPIDPDRRSVGVRDLERIPISTAITACRAAAKANPTNDRFAFQLGRAVTASGRFAEGVSWYRKAIDLGHVGAIVALGNAFGGSGGVAPNAAEAVRLYRQAAARGNAEGMLRLGESYGRGSGVAADKAEARRLLRQAADVGGAEILLEAARIYALRLGVPEDEVEALRLARKAADLGSGDAFVALAFMYGLGKGVERDVSESARLVRRAADLGSTIGIMTLAVMQLEGTDIERNEAEALRLARKAAAIGDVRGLIELADRYAVGHSIQANMERAALLYREAASAENARDLFQLAEIYETGERVTKDVAEAARLYRKSAEFGYVASLVKLAEMYGQGRGVEKNLREADRLSEEAGDEAVKQYGEKNRVVLKDYEGSLPPLANSSLAENPAQVRIEKDQKLAALGEPGIPGRSASVPPPKWSRDLLAGRWSSSNCRETFQEFRFTDAKKTKVLLTIHNGKDKFPVTGDVKASDPLDPLKVSFRSGYGTTSFEFKSRDLLRSVTVDGGETRIEAEFRRCK